MKPLRLLVFASLICMLVCGSAVGQTTAFTYQGKLSDGGSPATGTYEMQFKVFDTSGVGTGSQQPLATPVTLDFTVAGGNAVSVVNGSFTVMLDFGGAVFPGTNRFLEISVRHNSGESFAPLAPRQPISSTPYAVRSLNSANADNATTAATATTATIATNALQLNGLPASQYVLTGDSRLTDARPPTAGSANYIQNGTSSQGSSNFNISGSGTVGDTLSGNIVNAASQYNLGSNRVLSNAGTDNLFAGIGSGAANTTGQFNAFYGKNAGNSNTTGVANAFFGREAGFSNTIGGFNSFFGNRAGLSNTGDSNSFFGNLTGASNTTGNSNSFFGITAGGLNTTGTLNVFVGKFAGVTNATGSNNTVIGSNADVATNNLDHATAIGADAKVTGSNTVVLGRSADAVQVPGGLTVTGTFNASGANITNVNASNISSGTLDNARLGVVPIANGGTGSATQNFVDLTSTQTIAGDKSFSNTLSGNTVNAVTQYNLGGSRLLSNAGTDNLFAGVGAATALTSGFNNAFFGKNAGQANTTGSANSFFGKHAGQANTTGGANSFFGTHAGLANTTGDSNSFFGTLAGDANTTGSNNSFFGFDAGLANTSGNQNSFFGFDAGRANTTGSDNSFFGLNAGVANTVGKFNLLMGYRAGDTNTSGDHNTIIGDNADVAANNLDNATAIGASAQVAQNNSLVLGSINGVNGATASTSVGIGTTAPSYPLTVNGSAGAGQTQGAVEFSNGAADTGVRISNSTAGGRNYTLFSSGTGSGIGVGSFNIFDATANSTRLSVNSSGNVGIGTINPSTFKLQVAGAVGPNSDNASGLGDATHRWTAVFAANGTIQTSDGRLKQRLQNLRYGLNTVLQLRPVSFEWKDRTDTRTHLGLVAQEVEKIIPEVIQRSPDPSVPLGMSYTDLVPVLIKAIQEQQAEFAQRDTDLKSLKAENVALKEANAQLNARMAALEQAMRRKGSRRRPR